jgi:uncharacterized membrane protein
MSKMARLFRHFITTNGTGRMLFPQSTLDAIEDAITAGETRHRAEVHMIVESALPLGAVWNGTSARERARELFSEYRIWDTEENCGVLVYVNIADHQVEIVADRGVGHVVALAEWQGVCDTMTRGFARNAYHDGVMAALGELNALLEKHYPDQGRLQNQLSNRPLVL